MGLFYEPADLDYTAQLTSILNISRAGNKGVVTQLDVLRIASDANANLLPLTLTVLKLRSQHRDIVGSPLDVDANAVSATAVVADGTVFDTISMSAPEFVYFFTKENARRSIAFNETPGNEIVRITVPDTDAKTSVL